MARMFVFSARLGLALVLAVLCLSGRTAHAQAAPVTFWMPNWPLGFGGNLTVDQSANTYGDFPGFDGSDARSSGSRYMRYNFPNGWFVGGTGTSTNGIGQGGAFGGIGAFHHEGVQVGYNFQNAGRLPLTVYAGFDTLKYDAGIGSPFGPFDSMSNTLTGYSAHAGVEIQPAPNVSLSLGFGYTQQPGRINSLALPGASPFGFGDRR